MVVVGGVNSNKGGETGVVVDIKDGRVIVEWVGEDYIDTCISYGMSPDGAICGDGCCDVCCVLGDVRVYRGLRC